MHSFWPESWTFRHVKDVKDLWKKCPEYRDIVDEPIALDTIKEKLDSKNVSPYLHFSYLFCSLHKDGYKMCHLYLLYISSISFSSTRAFQN